MEVVDIWEYKEQIQLMPVIHGFHVYEFTSLLKSILMVLSQSVTNVCREVTASEATGMFPLRLAGRAVLAPPSPLSPTL